MIQTYKNSFFITLGLLFLLPIFFIPGGALNLAVSKSVILLFGLMVALLVFVWESHRAEKLDIPWHPLILVIILLPVVYFVSALKATPSSLSLLGYNFEVGTFGFMLLGVLALLLVSMVFRETSRVLKALAAFLAAIFLVAIFVVIKIIFNLPAFGSHDILIWGNFVGNMGNSIGNWTDLSVCFSLVSVFSILTLGMITMKPYIKTLVFIVFVLSTVLLFVISFSTAFILTLAAAVFLLFYFLKIEKNYSPSVKNSITLSVIIGILSIVFLLNPVFSSNGGRLNEVLPRIFNIQNYDVRPSFSATLNVSKEVLSGGGFFGSGPNTFSRDWLIYKPVDVNATPFWALAFPFGVGFLPTQVASTGITGTLLWLAFFALLIFVGVKAIIRIPESRDERFAIVSAFLITFFLWTASFLYIPSATVLTLAFIFSGLLVAVSIKSGAISAHAFNLKDHLLGRAISSVIFVFLAIGVIYLGWIGFEKTASAYYFKQAVDLSNDGSSLLVEIEGKLNKALEYSQADTYYVALSRINFAQAQAVAQATTGKPEENQRIFGEAIKSSIEAAKNAVNANSEGYQNWLALGTIYSALVPAPLSVTGAYDSALYAYSEASKRNPANPELPLLLARLEFSKGDKEAARSYVKKSVALKEDYADAHLALAQLEIDAGNTREAIVSAEKLAAIVPNNPGLYFELGVLKYSIRDYKGAADVFNQALIIVPDYANAKYYLGLTLSALGRKDEAIAQFEELLTTNPDNPELKQALKNLNSK